MEPELENMKPTVFQKTNKRIITPEEWDNDVADEFDPREIFGKISTQYDGLKSKIINRGMFQK